MSIYKPALPFTVPIYLHFPVIEIIKGVAVKSYGNKTLIYCSFKTYGGTEVNSNGVLALENTAIIETWYREDITANCVVSLAESGKLYSIIGIPENISMKNKFLKFKVKAIQGGA